MHCNHCSSASTRLRWSRLHDLGTSSAETETTKNVVQTPPAAHHENLLRAQPQPRRQGPQAALSEDRTGKANLAGWPFIEYDASIVVFELVDVEQVLDHFLLDYCNILISFLKLTIPSKSGLSGIGGIEFKHLLMLL